MCLFRLPMAGYVDNSDIVYLERGPVLALSFIDQINETDQLAGAG